MSETSFIFHNLHSVFWCLKNIYIHKRRSTRTNERTNEEMNEKNGTWKRKENRLHVSIDSGCQDITSRGLKSRIAFNKWISIAWNINKEKQKMNKKTREKLSERGHDNNNNNKKDRSIFNTDSKRSNCFEKSSYWYR